MNDKKTREPKANVPAGWVLTTLGDLAVSMKNGLYKPRDAYSSKGVACLRMYNIDNGKLIWKDIKRMTLTPEDVDKYRLLPGDLLVNRVNSRELVGKAMVIPSGIEVCVFESKNIRVRLNLSLVNSQFLNYILLADGRRYFANNAQQVVGMASISQPQIGAFRVPLAPLHEQDRIVAEIEKQFTRLDAAVAGLKRVRANLKRYRAAVLKAASEGCLVPTEAELARAEGRYYEPADLLLQRIRKERRTKWECDQLLGLKAQGRTRKDDKWKEKYKDPVVADSRALPNLPEGWVWARWEQVGLSQNGQSFPSKDYQATGIKLLRPGNLHPSGRVSWTPENTRRLPEKWATDFPRFIVGSRELVINLTAQSLRDEFLGRVCITRGEERCLLNQRIARLTPIEVTPEYFLWTFKSSVFRRFVNGLNTGSLIQHMFTSQLADFCVPLPPLTEQGRIVAEVERRLSLLDEIESLVEVNLKRAGRLRQSILKRAFEGKLIPQDPNDEPASILLERIRTERMATIEHAASRERGNRLKKRPT